ncbi:SAVED domain-containing protein [Motilimonas sp. 1_MG-2023]|uniref:Hachiman antiphage defense system protein HamA n=1 Tax=Motilimonas sp. 1_MG-2023 TaxID=3062672 RepID=UPI0026E3A305|nr:Hachiman antiphage defense system protein HamA [Motilimonas sp. 1_MG-2023]MDO6524621.1 SAVED domain-containing protein [Motilimonas sp. 1_MG-2023]
MLNITDKSVITDISQGHHSFKKVELKGTEFQNLIEELINLLPNYYIDPLSMARTLERLGKPAAAAKLRIKLPEVTKIRSGDIGEILTTDYIDEKTVFSVPIKKLRWKDHRNMAMRGDDVIGVLINQENQTIKFLKAEAKSNQALSRDVLKKARDELDLDEGLPAPHALEFVAERLRETGNQDLADFIEKAQLVDGIANSQVEHLLFTFTSSNPETLQKEAFEGYIGNIKQSSVGFQVINHQELITSVYQGVLDGLDD